jgi:hypothetical protein
MMNKKALGLSALGFLVFTAPAFAQDKSAGTKSTYKEETDVGKKGSSYKAEKTTQSSDAIKSTTDQDKLEKSTKKDAKGGMTTESSSTSKQPAGTGGSADSKTDTTKEKTETGSSGNVEKEKKTKN